MLLREEVGGGVVVVTVDGLVTTPDAAALVEAVQSALDARPPGVVVDLAGVSDVEPGALAVLRGLVTRAHGWPRTRLCLSGPVEQLALALPGLPTRPTREQAVAEVAPARCPQRQVVRLDPGVRGPAQARRIVEQWAARLGLDRSADDLVLVVSEMVTNAVRYGEPPVELEVVSDDETVSVGVADASPRAPRPRAAGPEAESGRGMALVDLLSAEHGVHPCPPGKTVWASVRRRPDDDAEADRARS